MNYILIWSIYIHSSKPVLPASPGRFAIIVIKAGAAARRGRPWTSGL
jgi:hypothetical protein